MGVFAYVVYAVGAFALYMAYLFGLDFFVEWVLPWIAFVIVLFAPLIWTAIRAEKDSK